MHLTRKGGGRSSIRYFLHETIIDSSYVFRKFEVSSFKEVSRFVFGEYGVILERPDKTMVFTTVDHISEDIKFYDTLADVPAYEEHELYTRFIREVRIDHKDEIIRAMQHVNSRYQRLAFLPFSYIYKNAVDNRGIDESVPERIKKELAKRSHKDGDTVRILKDLVVVVSEQPYKYLDLSVTSRAYFDRGGAYFFRQNPVTGKWRSGNLTEWVLQNRDIRNWWIDSELFDNTCLERYAGLPAPYSFKHQLAFGALICASTYLSAEQAAKTSGQLFHLVYQNIHEGKITDDKVSLPEILGVTGPQIKYLKNYIQEEEMPQDLTAFAQCVRSEEFKRHYPDIKKRIFAVCFYLSDNGPYRHSLTSQTVCAASKTINALERTNPEKRSELIYEFRDYLKMHQAYQAYIRDLDDENPLCHEIEAFGEMPLNMKPSKIHDYHNRIQRVLDILDCSTQILMYTAAIEERKKNEASQREYTDGTYSIIMPANANDIIREGRELCHCVGRAGYIEAMAAKRDTILFLRENKNIDKPLITIEEKNGSIRQCYGYRDSYNSNSRIRDFIQDYADRHDLKINAKIYVFK
ncbi:MAG: PcfJ domain-containing protein [Lachnospiraceae bacterium]|nr:PcfJ domain-containing protein [Lachnospiraceae bacterium]